MRKTMSTSKLLSLFCAFSGATVLVLAFNNCGQPVMTGSEASTAGEGNLATPATDLTPVGGGSTGDTGGTPAIDPSKAFNSIAGVYSSGGALQIVLPDGEYWTISGYGIMFTRTGKITQAANGAFTGEVNGGNGGGRGAIAGSFVAGTSFNGGTLQASSRTPASINNALGTFWGNSQDGDTPYLTFASNGNITGYSANFSCQFRGKAEPHASGINVLKITLTRSNCLGNGQSTTYTGIARAYGTAVHVVGVNAAKTATFTYEGYLESR